jgi:hypothetical protein
MPKIKSMNNLINIDDEIYKAQSDEKKVKQSIFEGKNDKKKKEPKKKITKKKSSYNK